MSDARILDQGYRRYDGPRHGPGHSILVITSHGVGRALGRRRGAVAKILPILILVIAALPAATFVGMAALLPRSLVAEGILPSYGEYYGYITSAIVIFSAFVAPDLLCTDRRTKLLGLLLASPLDRRTYLLGKALAVLAVLAVITIGPPLLMLVAFTLEGAGPESFSAWLTVLARIVAGGAIVAGVHTALSLAIASFTDRTGFASAGVLLALLLSSAVAGILTGAGGAATLVVLDLLSLPFELITRLYPDVDPGRPEVATEVIAAANLGWTLLFAGIVVWRYQRLQVTR